MTRSRTPWPLGIQASVWTSSLDADDLASVLEQAAGIGYDVIEVVVPSPANIDAEAVRVHADAAGVRMGMVTALGLDADITNANSLVRARGRAHLLVAVDTARQLGATVLGGVLHGALARHRTAVPDGGAERAADVLREVAGVAEEAGVRLGLEVVNRYGNNLLNTAVQAREFCELVGSPAVGIHLDTFHMNIEEANVPAAVAETAGHLMHVHVGESDRGHLGDGRFEFDAFFAALAEAGYDGDVVVETFSPSTTPELAGAVAAWRPVWDDPNVLATRAWHFLDRYGNHI